MLFEAYTDITIVLSLQMILSQMKRILFLSGLLIVLFSSCEKAKEAEIIDTTKEKKLLVDSIITLNEARSQIIDYDYDDKNRLISYKQQYPNNPGSSSDRYDFVYNSKGDLIKTNYVYGDGYLMTNDFVYNATGTPLKATHKATNYPSGNYETEFTVANGSVTNKKNINEWADEAEAYLYNNKNQVSKTYNRYSDIPDRVYAASIKYEYGTKNNPFKYTGNKWFLPDIPYANQNELLKATLSDNGIPVVTVYENSYNKEGYPTHVKVTETRFETQVTHSEIYYKYITAK